LEGNDIEMERVFHEYTLDIAWKQILGLDLTEEEVPEFIRYVDDWLGNIMNPLLLMPFRIPGLMTFSKVGRAHTYLVSKVEDKLAKLDRDGPDDSTMSKLYFATDDDGTTKLTRRQVIDNAMLLIVAGSETSSSTLTVASLLLGLHPNVWEKIKAEQTEIRSKYGEELTQQTLESCTYLEAVIKETMRIKPLEAQEMRKVEKTIVVDGKQIPKGWYTLLNIKQTHVNDPKVYKEDGSHMVSFILKLNIFLLCSIY
jgi:cytochrome P450